MDRMQPPPNYYGAPYNGFGPNMGPNGPMPNPQTPPGMGQPGMNPPMGQMPPAPMTQPMAETIEGGNDSQPSDGNNYYNDTLYTETNNNRGKKLRVYCSFTDSSKWHDVIFEGTLVYVLADHICVKTKDDVYTIIVGIYINYIEYLDKPVIPGFN